MSQHDLHMLPFVDFFGYPFLLYWSVVGLYGLLRDKLRIAGPCYGYMVSEMENQIGERLPK